MPQEIEAKIQVSDLAPTRQQLLRLGALLLHSHLEINTFFDTPDSSLGRSDRGLRIRVARDLQSGAAKTILTHKGPRSSGPFKSRPETELTAADADAAEAFLKALGYRPTLSFEKRRDSYRLADCQVELDTLPYLGCFVEIEGPSAESIRAVRSQLELDSQPLVADGYATLLARLALPTAKIRFPT